MGVKDCSLCHGACCKYVAMEIDVPEEMHDFENIRWYVAHENIAVYVDEENTWNIEFATPCKYLNENNLCSIHEQFVKNSELKRPAICKEFDANHCPHHNEYEEKVRFTEVEHVDDYIRNVFLKGQH
jgi:hypothetical protein